ncbi:MAG: bifunctional hydroxymethylpyrimidine kinase/phosphomethylpyrimidine kinase [Actinobacteria bacterium]|nr:bifunctional hydroxymethylpyrimidine kinase/phosphomethylpyrimidine kinase [Actinomycetota bacterium]
MRVPTALTIAGSDPSGGAGIQADLKTFLACGVHGMSAITACTAQNTLGVSAVQELPPWFVREQMDEVCKDIPPGAAKTGMLASRSIVQVVAKAVYDFDITNLVVDPVFLSKSGHALLSGDSVEALKTQLLPRCLLVTPNLHEAAALTGTDVGDLNQMRKAARMLHQMGPRHVLVKGGHLSERATDILSDGESLVEISSERIDSKNTHGTGCTLAAAIAAYLAKGISVEEAVRGAKAYVTGAIRYGLELRA